MWAMAASISDKYLPYEDILYERARTYIHEAEMKVGFSTWLLSVAKSPAGPRGGVRVHLLWTGLDIDRDI